MNNEYLHFMQQCLSLAKEALAAGNAPVGAVLVFDGEVIGAGSEAGKSTGDITNHAEIIAVRDAINNGHLDKLHASVMYTSHEPCIMCSYVIRHHHIPQVVYGVAVPELGGASSGFNVLTSEEIRKWGVAPKVVGGICLSECLKLCHEFDNQITKF